MELIGTVVRLQLQRSRLKPGEKRDRAKLALPSYYPDTPAVRECVGKYHDDITALDYTIGDLMAVIDKLPNADNTVCPSVNNVSSSSTIKMVWLPRKSSIFVP